MQVIKVRVKPQKDRLDQFVSDSIKPISRTQAKKLVKEGYILVNDQISNPAYKVRKGDRITVELPVREEISLQAEKIPLKIIYEDLDILVIDKPPFIVTHPTLDHPSGTIVNAVLNHLADIEESDLRPGIVHRLDKNTSGVLVIAKNKTALDKLKDQFKTKTVKKSYIALVDGRLDKEVGKIEEKIDRHPKFRSKFSVSKEGREAVTDYKVLKRYPKATLLQLQPQTGRTHQLRVHLSHIGHPIVGDKLYGGKMLLSRQFLHASSLELNHPKTGGRMTFKSALAKDLQTLLDKLDRQ